ncbi:MAG: MMPL family transporter [Lentisphaeraceae bacterium]|nr:MMPL family transporter [Lentisphaeraceae bacterium]
MKTKTKTYLISSLFLLATLLPLAYWSAKKMTLDTSIQQILGTDKRSQDTYQKFNQAFESNTAVIAIAKIPDLFSDEGVKSLYNISQAMATIPNLSDIKSLTHSARPVKNKFSFDITKMVKLEPFVDLQSRTEQDWQKVKTFLTHYPMTQNILVAEDGSYAVIMGILNKELITLKEKKEVRAAARKALSVYQEEGIEIHFLSEPFITAEFHELLLNSITYYVALSLLLASIIILTIFRSLRILILMFCYILCGLLCFPIIFSLNKADINVYTFVIIPLISAIQLTFLTHFYSVFQRYAQTNTCLTSTLKLTLQEVTKPSFLALITTGIGLASLWATDLTIISTVGKIGLQSLVIIFIITFAPPYIFSLRKAKEEGMSHKGSVTKKSFKLLSPKLSLALSILIFLISFVFMNKIEVDIRTKEFLQENSETRQTIEIIDQNIGGVNVFQLSVITNKAKHIQTYEVLKYMHDLRLKVLKNEAINSVYSYSQLYTTIHQLFVGGKFSIGNILPNKNEAMLYSQIINNQSMPFSNILHNEDLSEASFFIRTKDVPSKVFLNIVKDVIEQSKENCPPNVQVSVKDGLNSLLESDQNIVNTQIKSLGWSLTGVLLILLIIWGSLKLSLITVLVNCLPISIGVIYLQFSQTPLNSINVMIASIVLGVAVDDAIHFISYFNKCRKEEDTHSALLTTLSTKAKPIICTSLILASCLILFLLAPFPPIVSFGRLGFISIIGALLSTLFILPSLLWMQKNTHNDR